MLGYGIRRRLDIYLPEVGAGEDDAAWAAGEADGLGGREGA